MFNEAFRVLRSRLDGSLLPDIVARRRRCLRRSKPIGQLHTGCMAGASQIVELEQMLQKAGFKEIKIAPEGRITVPFIREWLPGKRIEDYLVSATIEG